MGKMGEESFDLLNIDQEDDNLLGVSPANAELCLGVSPLSPSMMPVKQTLTEDVENCYGNEAVVCVPAVVGADLDVNVAPVPCRSPMVPSSVLSVLNFNEMNKRNVNRDGVEEPWYKKGYGTKESMQLDGIAETSPVKNPATFVSQLSRSYLDIENEQARVTPEKGDGEPTVLRKSRSRRSTTLRKSLAWDKAFFTDEGVLDNDELFAVASDTPKTLPMPELATIWDGPQNLIAPFEAKTTPVKTQLKPDVKPYLRPDVKPDVRPAVHPKPQQDVLHTSSLRPDVLHTSSLRPVRQIHTSGSHAFSNAYSRAAAIPQGSTSIPLPNSLSRPGKQLGVGSGHPTEHAHGTGPDMKEPRTTTTGLHHQARIAALKKAHETPQRGPRVRLPNPTSSKKVDDKPLEMHKMKQPKKVEDKHIEELHKMHSTREKPFKKVEDKPSEDTHKVLAASEKQPLMTRSMSTSNFLDSPSALSRKVSSMSKKVKETLGKVMSGRARRVLNEPSLAHVHPVEKTAMLSKRSGALPTVPEVKDPSHRARSNAAIVPIKVNKEVYTVRDILRGKGPPASSKQGPILMRSKSACSVPGLPRATDPGLAKVIALPAPLPPFQAPEPAGKPTGLRKPSPKLGFFDAGRASSAPQKVLPTSQPFQGTQPARPGSEVSIPIKSLGQRSHGLAPVQKSSAIPSAPHLRHGAASAPTSPRRIHELHPSSPKCNSTKSTRPSSPNIESVENPINFSRIRHAKHFAESHQLLSKKMLPGDVNCNAMDSFKLPEAVPSSTELGMKPAEHLRGSFAKSCAESNVHIPTAVRTCSKVETGGGKSEDNIVPRADLLRIENSDCCDEIGETRSDKQSILGASDDHSSSPSALEFPSSESSDRKSSNSSTENHDLVTQTRDARNSPGRLIQDSSLQGSTFSDDKCSPLASHCSQEPGSELLEVYHSNYSPASEKSSPNSNDTDAVSNVSEMSNLRTSDSAGEGLEETREFSNVSNALTSSSLEQPENLISSSGNRRTEITMTTVLHFDSPRSRSFREMSTKAVSSCDHATKATRENDLPPSACPSTTSSKERSHILGAKVSRHYESPRSKSFRETSIRSNTPSDSPGGATKHVRSFSQRIPWQSPGGKAGGESSPGVCPSTPASAGKRHSLASPSHAPDAAGSFEVLTPTSSKAARCVRTPGSSAKKVIRKIVEFESPSSQWSNWPVLGAAISADQVPGSVAKEGLSSATPKPSRELANISASVETTPTLKVRQLDMDRAADEQCVLASEEFPDSARFLNSPTNVLSVEMRGGSIDRDSVGGVTGTEVSGSAKKDKGSSMFSFARKAVARLTSSPNHSEPSGQENEASPRSSRKASRRFSRSGSNGLCPASEPKPLSPFSEARICELEAAGPEILQKKNGPVQNSPPDKVVPDANPWSPVRKNGQPLGPFDCTKLKYTSPSLTNS